MCCVPAAAAATAAAACSYVYAIDGRGRMFTDAFGLTGKLAEAGNVLRPCCCCLQLCVRN
jgi:hypothetical protein